MRTYMIGIMLIDAKNLASAKKKYARAQDRLKKELLREKAQRIAWLNKEPVKVALQRLCSGC